MHPAQPVKDALIARGLLLPRPSRHHHHIGGAVVVEAVVGDEAEAALMGALEPGIGGHQGDVCLGQPAEHFPGADGVQGG